MKKRVLRLLVLLTLLWGICAAPTLSANQVSVAIMPFTEGQLTHWWGWDWNLGEGVTNLVIDEIVKRGKLSVVERTRVQEIMAEQNLAASGRIEPDTASRIGKLLGARLLVMGTITEWDFKQSGGIGFSFLRISGSMAKVKLTGRVVDSQTGVVLGSFQGEGSKTGTSFSIDSYKGVSINGEQFAGSTLGQATTDAISQFVDELIKVTEKVAADVSNETQQQEQTGKVMAVIGDQIVINLGSKHGIKMNTVMNISHPQVIPGLKDPVKLPIGKAVVISVDAEVAVLKVQSKTQEIVKDDLVTLQ